MKRLTLAVIVTVVGISATTAEAHLFWIWPFGLPTFEPPPIEQPDNDPNRNNCNPQGRDVRAPADKPRKAEAESWELQGRH